MRRLVVLALLALALPMAAWASGIDFTNQYGTISVSAAGLTTTGSELLTFGTFAAAAGHSLGWVSYTTGALISGSVTGNGGVFSSTGSTFDIIGRGAWAKSIPGYSHGSVTLFAGSFVGPIDWTLVSTVGQRLTYTLTGDIIGTWYTGRQVSGTTTQTILTYKHELADQGKGNIGAGGGNITVPEPGTLGLLGTGLVGMAGMLRRKMMGS